MSNSTQIKQDEAFKAIEDLLAAGVYPTNTQLREKLGRGSPVTAQKFLSEWYEKNGPEFARKATARRQADADESVHLQLRNATEQALKDYDKTVADRNAALDDRKGQLDALQEKLLGRERKLDARESAQAEHLADLRAAVAEAAQARDAALDSLSEADVEIAALTAQLKLKDEALARGHSELAAASALAATVPVLEAGLERLKDDLAREQRRVLEVVGERDRALAESSRLKGDLRAGREKLELYQGELSDARVNLAAARSELAAAVAHRDGLQAAIAKAEATYLEHAEDLRAAIAAARKLEEALRDELAARDKRILALTTEVQGSTATSARLEGERGQLVERIRGLEALVKACNQNTPKGTG